MTRVRRLEAVCAVLAVLAGFSAHHVWGDSAAKQPVRVVGSGSQSSPDDTDRSLAEELAQSKFSRGGVITYRTRNDETIFALGLKPQLDPAPARPRDILVMVDTSASQVGGPLHTAQAITEKLVAQAKPEDRIAIWTVNIPKATKDITHGFQPAGQTQEALNKLQDEVPLGDTDLKNGLEEALKSFGGGEERQRVLVFLGDGMSTHNPLSPAERSRLCQDMVKNEVAIFWCRWDPSSTRTTYTALPAARAGWSSAACPVTRWPTW